MIPDSDEALREYGNSVGISVGKANLNVQPSASAIELVHQALKTNDATPLKELEYYSTAYGATLESLLAIPVPLSLVSEHLQLLNSIAAMRSDVDAMRVVLDDPLFALAAISRFQKDVDATYASFSALNTLLTEKKIAYAKEEPGSFFYTFDI
jgi:hypothetical protein